MSFSATHQPTLPSVQPVPSYWRKHVEFIDEHRTTDILPSRADIIIIGAGYAGASIAHHLLEEVARCNLSSPSIIILEAREACSGATGRNGGHLKPDPLSRAAGVLKTHGKATAEHVASFEACQIKAIKELVRRENIDCDFEETRVTDVCLYKEGHDKILADLRSLDEAGISTAKTVEYHQGSAAEKVSGVRGATLCLTYSAARLWPYRLVTHMLKKAVSQGINLQTRTPVRSVCAGTEGSKVPSWVVNTDRGSVVTPIVIYATNGYTSGLIPELQGRIVPVRGMCASLVGTATPKMTDSFMMRFSDFEYDYMIPRPDGSIVLGGGRRDYFKDLDAWFNVTDDSNLIEGARHYFDGYMQRHFHAWKHTDVCTKDIWTGIMGYSSDGFPYVGPVREKLGQYVCAGFNGHGMPQIFLSAKAIASMVLNTIPEEELDLPSPYRTSPGRWCQQKEHVSLQLWRAVSERKGSGRANL